jgi:hypothetical protein
LQPAGSIGGQVNETNSTVVQQAFDNTLSIKTQWCAFVRFFVVFHLHRSKNKMAGSLPTWGEAATQQPG